MSSTNSKEILGQNKSKKDKPSLNDRRRYPEEVKNAARSLFLRHWKVAEIAETLGVPERTIYDWSVKGTWLDLLSHEGPDEAINRRLEVLVGRDNKTQAELREIDLLISSQERRLRMREREVAQAAAAGQAGEAEPELRHSGA